MLGGRLLDVSELLQDKQAAVLFFTLCVLDNTRNKVSDLTDSALFQDESEPAESKHVQISKQDFSCKPGLAACLRQQHQGSGEFI